VWQVKSGTIFDNFLVTDDETLAKEWAERIIKQQEKEREAHAANKEEEDAEDPHGYNPHAHMFGGGENPHGFNPHGNMFGGGENPHAHGFGEETEESEEIEDADGEADESSFHAAHGHHHDEL